MTDKPKPDIDKRGVPWCSGRACPFAELGSVKLNPNIMVCALQRDAAWDYRESKVCLPVVRELSAKARVHDAEDVVDAIRHRGRAVTDAEYLAATDEAHLARKALDALKAVR